MKLLILTAAAYLIGSVPTGLIVGKIGYQKDLRRHGSGNIGFTNARRVLGNPAGFLVLALDVFKGAGTTLAVAWIWAGKITFPLRPDAEQALAVVLGALAVILGNVFSVYIGFKGGKGVGVGAGIVGAMAPDIMLTLLIVWSVVTVISRYVSLGSVLIAGLLPVLMWLWYGENKPYLIFSILAAAVVVWRHRGNIKRLLAGQEMKIGRATGT